VCSLQKGTKNAKGKKQRDEEEEEDDDEGGDEDDDDDDEEGDGMIELTPAVIKRIAGLRRLYDLTNSSLDSDYKKERIALEEKYRALRLPSFEQRKKIVTGEIEVPAELAPAPAEGEAVADPGELYRLVQNNPEPPFIFERKFAFSGFILALFLVLF